jgi:hypothetical protein
MRLNILVTLVGLGLVGCLDAGGDEPNGGEDTGDVISEEMISDLGSDGSEVDTLAATGATLVGSFYFPKVCANGERGKVSIANTSSQTVDFGIWWKYDDGTTLWMHEGVPGALAPGATTTRTSSEPLPGGNILRVFVYKYDPGTLTATKLSNTCL